MAWLYLLFAGLFEVGYASTLKLTEGFTQNLADPVFRIVHRREFHMRGQGGAGNRYRYGL